MEMRFITNGIITLATMRLDSICTLMLWSAFREGCRGTYVFARLLPASPFRLFIRESFAPATHFRNGPYRVRMEHRLEGKIYFVIMKIIRLSVYNQTCPRVVYRCFLTLKKFSIQYSILSNREIVRNDVEQNVDVENVYFCYAYRTSLTFSYSAQFKYDFGIDGHIFIERLPFNKVYIGSCINHEISAFFN